MNECHFCGKPATVDARIYSTLGIYTTAEERPVELCGRCYELSKDRAWLNAQEKKISKGINELCEFVNNSQKPANRRPPDPGGDAAARFRARQGVSSPPMPPSADRPAVQGPAAETRIQNQNTGPLTGQCEFCGIGYRAGDKKCCSCGAALPVTVPGKLSKKELERIEAESKAAAEAAAARKAEADAKRAAKRKKILKIVIPCLCAAILAAAGILIGFAAANARAEKGLFYEEYENGYILTGAGTKYSATELVIPSSYKGLPVLKIGDGAFQNNKTIEIVTIPAALKEIGGNAFSYCDSLKKAVFESGSNPALGNFIFSHCNKLAEVDWPSSIKTLSEGMFWGTALRWFDLSEISAVPAYAFSNCSQLKAVYIKSNCGQIEANAFSSCPQLTIYYSGPQETWEKTQGAAELNSVAAAGRLIINVAAMDFNGNLFFIKYLELDAFAVGANSLFDAETFTLPSSFGGKTVSGILPEGFLNASIKALTIPDSVGWIHERAFKGCSALKTISLPGTLSIGQYAFEGCSSLNKIYIRCRPADDNVLYDPAGNQYFTAATEEYVY